MVKDNLPIDYIRRKRGAWLMDINKEPNSLTTTDMKNLDEQLNEMIFSKYRFIPYNGLRPNRLVEMSENYTKNPFDNKVVIIDEAHNFISRIVNRIEKERPIAVDDRGEKEKLHKSLSLKLYEFLLSAKNMRIVLLSGTPIINYPNELGIMFNILRGYIKTWEFPVVVKTSKKVTTETLQKMLINEKILDYLEKYKLPTTWEHQVDPKIAVQNANILYTDVWVSMGCEKEAEERKRLMNPFQINQELLQIAGPDSIFMHCMPTHPGEEVSESVLASPQAILFDQAENRLHMQKAILRQLTQS